MSYDDPPDDEDWYDEDADDKSDEEETGRCPECRGPVYEFTDKCPACGYYLAEADRRQFGFSHAKPKWVLITAVVILTILTLGVLTLNF